jgi:tetratricopeptide (TPR) repeat protein
MELGRTHYEYAKLGERIWNERDVLNPGDEAKQGLADMLTHAEACIAWRTKAHELSPRSREYTRLLANATMGWGQAKIEQQQLDHNQTRFSEAEELIKSSQSMRERLLEETADDIVQTDLARGLVALADLRVAEARTADEEQSRKTLVAQSLELRKQAIEIFENLPFAAMNIDVQTDLGHCYQSLGTDYAAAGDYEQAIRCFEKLGTTLNPLLLSNPGVYKFRKGVADAQFNLAQLLLHEEDNLGLDYVADFQKTLVNALIVDPRNHDAIDLMVGYSDAIATGFAETGSFPEAIRCLEDAQTLLAEAKLSAANGDFIEATIKRIQERIDGLRKDSNAEDRTATLTHAACWRHV